jgi:hypothetical protein
VVTSKVAIEIFALRAADIDIELLNMRRAEAEVADADIDRQMPADRRAVGRLQRHACLQAKVDIGRPRPVERAVRVEVRRPDRAAGV